MKKFSAARFVINIMLITIICFVTNDCIINMQIEKNKEVYVSKSNYEGNDKPKYTEIIDGDLKVYFFYVGQADCILVRDKDKTMLIDAGNNYDGELICEYLKSLDISKIDYLIGTHAHEDHIGGLDNVIENFDIDTIYIPKKGNTTRSFEEVLDAISAKGLKVKTPEIGNTFKLKDAVCEIVYVDNDAENLNNSSITVIMNYGSQKYLFAGDIEKEVENSIAWRNVDVLKVAHHGSKTSSTRKFLNQTKPKIAVISLGKNNDYGFPHNTTIDKLNTIGAQIYRTDMDGTILIKSDGKEIFVEKLDVSLDGNY